MNEAQKSGHSIDLVLMATSYVLGAALGQRGCFLLGDAPVKNALSPLYEGYVAARKERVKS